jgi:hypothetical protein
MTSSPLCLMMVENFEKCIETFFANRNALKLELLASLYAQFHFC